ncbi:hypothetical protein [Pseudoflavonifractor sp. 60]|nr:hypothetical protein [Pseudoflavonifractor sp. 60]
MVFLLCMVELFRLLLMGDLSKKALRLIHPILLISQNYNGI